MRLCDINPHIRYAQRRFFKSTPVTSNVFDCRIFFALSGKAEISIQNKTFILTESSLFYCSSGSIYTISSDIGCDLLILNFDLEQTRNAEAEFRAPLHISKYQKPCFTNTSIVEDCEIFNNSFMLSDTPVFCSAIQNIIKEFNEKKIFYMEKSSVLLKNLLIDASRSLLSSMESATLSVENAISYIKENYMFQISNKDLSRVSCYHEFHLNRLFIKYTGMTIHKYIIETRISEAKNLLVNSNMRINEIAAATGFNANTHFASCFKKVTGLSPQEYRKNGGGII